MDTASSANIVVDQRTSALPGVFFICIMVGFFGLVSSVYYPFMFYVTIAILVAMVFFGLFVKTRAKAEIDLQERVALIHLESFVGKKETLRYPLSEIGAVRSCYFSGRNYQTYKVLLVPNDGKSRIQFAEYNATGPWDSRGEIEEESSRTLREDIARKCGLKDEGFIANGC